MEDCIFCKIARGEIPVTFVYQDENVVAFDDQSPQAPVHTLIIPRKHHESMEDDVDPELMGAVFSAVSKVAAIKEVDDSGYRVIVNNGPDSNQTVMHLHVHLIGGQQMSHCMVEF